MRGDEWCGDWGGGSFFLWGVSQVDVSCEVPHPVELGVVWDDAPHP